MNSIVELATIQLAPGKTEADLLAASQVFQRDFLDVQPGFVRRELVRKSSGDYADLIHWRSRADADRVMELAATSPVVHAYFSVMAMESDDPTQGVEHFDSLATYSTGER